MELRGGGIALRAWRLADVPAVTAACQDPEIPKWIPFVPSPYSVEDAEAYIRDSLESGPERHAYAIVDAATDEVLGSIDMGVNVAQHRGHIGYWMVAGTRGRGFCTLALKLLSRWAFDELGLQRLELITDPDNVASQRVAEKAGFRREGMLRAHLRHRDGRVRDSVMFSLLPGDLVD